MLVHCTLYIVQPISQYDLNRLEQRWYNSLSSSLEEISTKPQPWKNVCAAITQNCDWLESWNSVTKTNLYNNFFYEFWQIQIQTQIQILTNIQNTNLQYTNTKTNVQIYESEPPERKYKKYKPTEDKRAQPNPSITRHHCSNVIKCNQSSKALL